MLEIRSVEKTISNYQLQELRKILKNHDYIGKGHNEAFGRGFRLLPSKDYQIINLVRVLNSVWRKVKSFLINLIRPSAFRRKADKEVSNRKYQKSYEEIDAEIRLLQDVLSGSRRDLNDLNEEELNFLNNLVGINFAIDNKELKANKIHQYKLKLGQFIYLQPGHYHYDEETKLNAISILVSSKNTQDYAIIEEAINNLGKIELNTALIALNSLDLVEDELLYKMVDKYYNAYLSEYRIYCAWLLRNRYGKQPAEYITSLLMDKETRVHCYTFNLFEKRRIEKELVIAILAVIEQVTTIKPWHLVNMIKILGKRNQFYLQELVPSYGKLIVSSLMNLCSHSRASLRLEAYKALIQYDEFIERQFIISAMEEDKDIYIRRLAESIKLEN